MAKFVDLLLLVFITVGAVPVHGYDSSDGADLDQLILSVYVDEEGEALVIGYAEPESLADLPFLEVSEYAYDDDSKELYAITDALTSGCGDDSQLDFVTEASLDVYLVMFYLPSEAKLEAVNFSEGLDCLVSESDDSLVVEVWGYDVDGSDATIVYRAAQE